MENVIRPNGLINIGNSCFFNTALQCLNAIWDDYFITNKYLNDLPSMEEVELFCKKYEIPDMYAKPDSNVCKSFLDVYGNLVCALDNITLKGNPPWSQDMVKNCLIAFFRLASCLPPIRSFFNHQQQDAHDILIILIDVMEQILSYENKITITSSSHLSFINQQRLNSFTSWQKHFRNRSSWFTDNIYGQYVTKITCANPQCQHTSYSYDVFCHLNLSITETPTLEEALRLSFSSEKLEEKNAVRCDKCKEKTPAEKQMKLWHTPCTLIIQLKRFRQNGYMITKEDTLVRFPVSGLDITPWIENVEALENDSRPHGRIYNLVAVGNHGGSLNHGHYTAFRKVGQSWYEMDDENVREVPETNLVTF